MLGMAKRIGLILVSLAVSIYTIYRVFSIVHIVPIHVDEVSWFFHTEFYQLLLSGDIHSTKWQSYESYDHPQLSKYTYGFYLAQINKNIVKERDVLESAIGRWDFYFNNNFLSEISLTLRANVHSMRDINAFFMLFSIAILWIIFWKTTSGSWISFALPIVLVHNELFMHVMLRATSDAQTLCLINLSWYILFRFIETKKYRYLLYFGMISAFAMSAKLSGSIISMAYAMYTAFTLLLEHKPNYKTTAAQFVSVILLTGSIWIIINPALYSNPIQNTYRYMDLRMKQSLKMQIHYSDIALRSFSSKGYALWCTVFSPACSGSFTRSNLTPSAIINLALFWIGVVFMLVRIRSGSRSSFLLLNCSYAYMSIVLVTAYAPVYMDRYFLNISVMIVFIQMIGIFAISSKIKHSIKITPP